MAMKIVFWKIFLLISWREHCILGITRGCVKSRECIIDILWDIYIKSNLYWDTSELLITIKLISDIFQELRSVLSSIPRSRIPQFEIAETFPRERN
jgi:hypothetical protein